MHLKNLIPAVLILSLLICLGGCGKTVQADDDLPDADDTAVQDSAEETQDALLTADFVFTDENGQTISGRKVAFEYDIDCYYDHVTDENGKVAIDKLYQKVYNLIHLEDGNGDELSYGNFYFIVDQSLSEPLVEISKGGSTVVSIPSEEYRPELTITIDDKGFLACTAAK